MKNIDKKIQLLFNLLKKRNLPEAKKLNNALIGEYPKNAFLYNTLGLILFDEKKYSEAFLAYKKGLEINSQFAPLYNNLGNLHRFKKNFSEAENCFKKSIHLEKNNPESRNNLGNLYQDMDKPKEAIETYSKALDINSNFFPSHFNLAITYKNMGSFDRSRDHLNKAIKLKPSFFTAHRTLSQITTYKKNHEHFKLLQKIYEEMKLKKMFNSEFLFALGKAHEDVKDYDKAFFCYQEGNKIHRGNINFSINDLSNEFEVIKKNFTKDLLLNFKNGIKKDSTPIFIVGMPRSGTTLVEQILSTHEDVFGGDELNFLPDLISKYIISIGDILKTSNKTLNNVAEDYLKNLKRISKNSKRVTDKLPINFKWIGLIKILFPNSKVIHCNRNPRDNCLSIYKNFFTSNKMNFAFDINEICQYYNLYTDIMKHWEINFPNFIYNIKYEKLVESPEKEIKNLLKYCDLRWDSSCIKFYENKRLVKTTSDTQVRKKMYKSSIDSWANFKKNLDNKFNEYKI